MAGRARGRKRAIRGSGLRLRGSAVTPIGRPRAPGSTMVAETQDLLVLHSVVRHGNYGKAAEELGLSASGVSRVISRLEERLGVRLLQRTTRKLSLTEAGQAFHERTAHFLQGLEAAELELRERSLEPRGHLRVGAPVGLGQLFLGPALSRFAAPFRELTVELKLSDGGLCLEADGMNLLIQTGALRDTHLSARRLCSDRRFLVAAPEYLEQHGAPESVAALAQHRCVVFTGFEQPNEWVLSGPDGQHTVRVSGPISTNNIEVLALTASQGLGVAMAAAMSASPYLRSGGLCRVLPDYEFEPAEIFAYYSPFGALSDTVRRLLDFLLEELRNSPLGLDAT
jgi:DNA-binding transcriptional LysR family regulator